MSDPARTYDPRSLKITIEGEPLLSPVVTRDTLERLRVSLTQAVGIPAHMLGVEWSRMFEPRVTDGARGCFHEGCAPSTFGEGGSHWCRLAEEPTR